LICRKNWLDEKRNLSKGHDLDQVQFCGYISWH
jgi:hypothetical protein